MTIPNWFSPPPISILTLRLTLRVETACHLPSYREALTLASALRGHLGKALFKQYCSPACDPGKRTCAYINSAFGEAPACPYRTIFAPMANPARSPLDKVRDAPRPYALTPPVERETPYMPGETMSFDLVLAGKAAGYIDHVITAFQSLSEARLWVGDQPVLLILAGVESFDPLEGCALPLPDGEESNRSGWLLMVSGARMAAYALALPSTLDVEFITPIRFEKLGLPRTPDCPMLVKIALLRLSMLCAHFGSGPWKMATVEGSRDTLFEGARAVRIEKCEVEWRDWWRADRHGGNAQPMGGFTGRVALADVSPLVRLALVAGSLVHIGDGVVFGNGAYVVTGSNQPGSLIAPNP